MLVLIVDDHPIVCSALEATLTRAFSCKVVHAYSAADALKMVGLLSDIDLVLLDLKLPDVEGFNGLSQLRKQAPKLPILVISGLEDARLVQLVRGHGAMGFLSKKTSASDMLSAIRTVLAGETAFPDAQDEFSQIPHDRISQLICRLTPQQLTVLGMLGEGLLNKQIAYELSISESTVKAHVSAILSKLEVSSRTQAVLIAQGGMFNSAPEFTAAE